VTRRGIPTVDIDCERCGGTGVVQAWHGVNAGALDFGSGVFGGGASVIVESRCVCVQVAPVHSEADGGVSIGAPREEDSDG
jgi:hypothetical protein